MDLLMVCTRNVYLPTTAYYGTAYPLQILFYLSFLEISSYNAAPAALSIRKLSPASTVAYQRRGNGRGAALESTVTIGGRRTEIVGSDLCAEFPHHFPSRLFYPRFDVSLAN